MKVVAFATDNPANRHLLLALAREHDLAAVFNPLPRRSGAAGKLKTLQQKRTSLGGLWVALHKLADSRIPVGWQGKRRMREAQAAFFAEADAAYEAALGDRTKPVADVDDLAFVEEIRTLAPDVVICSGGPIYRAPLIRACGLMINYHTGISPIYNGAETNWWAYAHGHPQLCGGTLMVMNEAVDGGDILAHHFTGCEPDDDPADLFCKAILGGIGLYGELLTDLKAQRRMTGVKQPRPFFYLRGWDWTVLQALAVERRLALAKKKGIRLPERTVRYWRAETAEDAQRDFEREIVRTVAG